MVRREREKREAFALVEQATDILFRSKKKLRTGEKPVVSQIS